MSPSAVCVMADYECFPAWLVGSASTGNVDPAELPIPPASLATSKTKDAVVGMMVTARMRPRRTLPSLVRWRR